MTSKNNVLPLQLKSLPAKQISTDKQVLIMAFVSPVPDFTALHVVAGYSPAFATCLVLPDRTLQTILFTDLLIDL